MSFTIPNAAAATVVDQAEVDSVDFDLLVAGFTKFGVFQGVVASPGTGLAVDVTAGLVSVGGREVTFSANSVTLSAADPSDPRFDLISVDVDGNLTATAGTVSNEPAFPSAPLDETVIAAVYVAAGATSLSPGHIVDKRIILPQGPPVFVGDYGLVGDGVADDGPAVRSAAAVADAGHRKLIFPSAPIRFGSVVTDADGHDVCLPINSARVWVEGQGRGSGRSGAVGSHASTELIIDVACDYGVKFRSASGTPDWRGGGITGLHIVDATGSRVDDALLAVMALNDFAIDHVSLSGARKDSGARAFQILHPTNGQPTQYGRVWNMDVWDCYNGIWLASNAGGTPVAPDWKFMACQIQAQADSGGPVDAGSIGVYVNSNAFHLLFSEVQNFDTGVVIDQANGRGKHIEIKSVHFEVESSAPANSYEAAVEIISHTSAVNSQILLADCENPSPGKYSSLTASGSVIKATGTPGNIDNTRLRSWRIRDSSSTPWITSGNASNFIAGTGFQLEIDNPASVTI